MSALNEYEVEIGGLPHTILLSNEDAEARGLSKPKPKSKAAAAENKSRKPSNKSAS